MAEDTKQQDNQLQPEVQLSNRRIAKNALMLYIRMFLTMIVGLYTSRVVLATLGVEDYGIYGVVGGVVAMMGFLNASMSGATSRFLTFELGRGDQKRLADTFSSALIVHIGIALVVFVLAETIGLWFLCNKLVIPAGRMEAAHWVYQCSILSAMLGITQAPYNASIIAHEKMDVYAYIEILHVVLKLLIVYLLVIGNLDKLKLYAVLMIIVSIVIFLIYQIYCSFKFKETHFHWVWKKNVLKPLVSFSGWDLYGNGCVTIRQQSVNFLINMFFGVVYNAASSVATTVQGVVTSFAAVVVQAFRPQIIKSYAINDIPRMSELSGNAIKLVLLLFGCVAVPVIFEMEFLMKMWLIEVPQKSVVFCRILMIFMFFALANNIFIICIHSTGRIFRISLYTGSIHLLVVPCVYSAFKFGGAIELSYILVLIAGVFIDICNLWIIKKQIPTMNIKKLITNWGQAILIVILVSILTYFVYRSMEQSWLRLIVLTGTHVISLVFLSLFFVLTKEQRLILKNVILTKHKT